MEIYALNLNSSFTENWELERILPTSVIREVGKYKCKKDYRRSLIGYAALFILASNYLDCEIKNLEIDKNEWGKPYFKEFDKFHYNISHSGDWVVLAIDSDEVGIDVEFMEKFDYSEVVNSFFSLEEQKTFFKVPNKLRNEVFYRLWTLKESYLKAIGEGLSRELDSFTVLLKNSPVTIEKDNNFELNELVFDKNYKLSICHKSGKKVGYPYVVDIRKLYNEEAKKTTA